MLGSTHPRYLLAFVLYCAASVVLTWPAVRDFSSHFFSDGDDGLQTVWNFWWLRRAWEQGSSPLQTDMLYAPFGVPLLAHTLSLINTAPAAVLGAGLSLQQVYNLAFLASFVLSGVFAFALAWRLCGSFVGAFLSGYAFAFCAYRFAHAVGHLNLITTQWLVLFLLTWVIFLEKRTYLTAGASALSLWLVFFGDYYYFFYAVLAGGLVFLVDWCLRGRAMEVRAFAPALVFFSIAAAAPLLPFVFSIVHLSRGGFNVVHHPLDFSMDLLSPFVPGGYWRFADHIPAWWSHFRAGPVEGSCYVGYGLLALAALGLMTPAIARRYRITFGVLAAFFSLVALGPNLQVAGYVSSVPMPYRLLELIFPLLKMGGVPARLSVVSILACAVLAGGGLTWLLRERRWGFAAALCGLLVVESLPGPIARTPPPIYPFAEQVAQLASNGGIMDPEGAIAPSRALYFQTIHHLPQWGGYLSRVPLALDQRSRRLGALALAGRFKRLCTDFGFRYFVYRSEAIPEKLKGVPPLAEGAGLSLFDVGEVWNCRVHPAHLK